MKRTFWIVIIILGGYGLFIGFRYYEKIFSPNVEIRGGETFSLYVPRGSDFQILLDSLSVNHILKDTKSFRWLAENERYVENVKPGHYLLKEGWNNKSLINKLKLGSQDPVKLVLNNVKNAYELAGKLSKKLESDSLEFLSFLSNDSILAEYGLDRYTAIVYFLPNTYEFYWNFSPESILKRMKREFDCFWTESRKNKAAKLELTPIEVITLASMVEKETVQKEEMPTVAGLYFNRLKRNMKLQSDPTVIYGINQEFPRRKITRVYFKDLEYDSPYNTYMYSGLPPGPIKIPELCTIHAVLNYEKHDYIFMVSDPERPGHHNFAKTMREHQQNRIKYIRSINKH